MDRGLRAGCCDQASLTEARACHDDRLGSLAAGGLALPVPPKPDPDDAPRQGMSRTCPQGVGVWPPCDQATAQPPIADPGTAMSFVGESTPSEAGSGMPRTYSLEDCFWPEAGYVLPCIPAAPESVPACVVDKAIASRRGSLEQWRVSASPVMRRARLILAGADVVSRFTLIRNWIMRNIGVLGNVAPGDDLMGIISRICQGDLLLGAVNRHLLLKILVYVLGKHSQGLARAIVAKMPSEDSLSRHVVTSAIKTVTYIVDELSNALHHGSGAESCGVDMFGIEAEKVVERLVGDVQDSLVSHDGRQPSRSGRRQGFRLDFPEDPDGAPTASLPTAKSRLAPGEPQAFPPPVESRQALALTLMILLFRILLILCSVDSLDEVPEVVGEALRCVARLRAIRAI